MSKLVSGVGINDKKYPVTSRGKQLKEYDLWRNILARCYDPKIQSKYPTYHGCSVSESFKSYSYFYEWCQTQIGFGLETFQLDKDLIFKGNKLYSEDTCLFLPSSLNLLLIASRATRGSLPIGVSKDKGNFRASYSRNSSPTRLGIFKTPEEAFNAYKEAKEAFIKLQAEKWKPYIDPRAYATLMAYTVLITD